MAQAKEKSPAKPVHRLKVDNIHLTVWEGPRVTLQREYVFRGQAGYADSLRIEDIPPLKKALDQFVLWSEGFLDKKDEKKAAAPKAETGK